MPTDPSLQNPNALAAIQSTILPDDLPPAGRIRAVPFSGSFSRFERLVPRPGFYDINLLEGYIRFVCQLETLGAE